MFQTKILEVWAIIRILNWKRVANAFKAILFYNWGLFSKKAIIKHQPLALSIEPTSICNLKCPECPTGMNLLSRPRGTIALEEYQRIIRQLPPELMYLNLYIQGEPTMHPNFPDLVKLAHQKNLYTSTSTNGHFITPSMALKIVEAGMTRMIFSIDGTTQKTYAQYRKGGQLSKALDGIKLMIEARKLSGKRYPLIVMQFLVFKHNEHELEDINLLARKLRVDKLEIKTAQFNHYDTTSVAPPKINKFNRYEKNHQLKLKGKILNKCWRQWHSAVITWDGKVSQCCYDKDARHLLGNLNNTDFKNTWLSTDNMHFKKTIFSNKDRINICHNCPEGRSIRK